jgi:hypothetical protein
VLVKVIDHFVFVLPPWWQQRKNKAVANSFIVVENKIRHQQSSMAVAWVCPISEAIRKKSMVLPDAGRWCSGATISHARSSVRGMMVQPRWSADLMVVVMDVVISSSLPRWVFRSCCRSDLLSKDWRLPAGGTTSSIVRAKWISVVCARCPAVVDVPPEFPLHRTCAYGKSQSNLCPALSHTMVLLQE